MKFKHSIYIAVLIAGSFFIPKTALSQVEGIKFNTMLTWSAILSKAKSENKFIFMDCYATWCGPCKYMSQKVFIQKPVGDFFNKTFVNVSVQMDRTENDAMSIKDWYKDADSINKQYGINAYPTYLIFSPGGEVLDRFSGGLEANDFLTRIKEALDPDNQYYRLVAACKDNLDDSVFLRKVLDLAVKLNDNSNTTKVAGYLLSAIRDSFSIDNISLMNASLHSSSSDLFQFFLTNASKIDASTSDITKDYAESVLCSSICNDRVSELFKKKDAIVDYNEVLKILQTEYPTLANVLPNWVDRYFSHYIERWITTTLLKADIPEPDWPVVVKETYMHYPANDCKRLVAETKPDYYEYRKRWPECEKAALELLRQYGNQLDAKKINAVVWSDLFMHSTNTKVLKIALNWSKRSLEMDPGDCSYKDTYANLLYKLGDTRNALQWEKKAIMQCGVSTAEIRSNFHKMQKGKKTWTELAN